MPAGPGLGDVLLDRRARFLDVRAECELGNDQRDRVGRSRLELLQARDALDGRSIGSATCVATSVAPAPGYGATTVMTGKSMSGRSSCLSEPQAEMPATNSANASSSVTLRWLMARLERRLTGNPPG